MRILIVDDDAITRRILETMLKIHGYEPLTATNGQQAWELLQQDFVPLILTDWLMPSMDGIELIRRIRAANFPSYNYIVLITSLSTQSDIVHGLEAGADDFLTKPFHEGELLARLNIARRILELERNLRETRDQLYHQATHDSLTGLLNRMAIIDRATMELERSRRAHQPLSLALLDIDHFKRINDTFGHLVGNEVLIAVGQIVKGLVRPYDSVGRWGGEELLLVLPDTDSATAIQIAERIRYALSQHIFNLPSGMRLRLTVSVGVSCTDLYQSSYLLLDTLFQHADEALYTAKRSGRDQVGLFRAAACAPEMPLKQRTASAG